MIKRAMDLVVSAGVLTISSPALLAIAVAVKTTSPGPAIFTQQRVGLGGATFDIHKFRTMRVDHDGLAVSGTGDPRVTSVGRILRKTKLDELPQCYDVLRGKMSLVGPRPEVPHYVALWPGPLRPLILSVRPGITDPASIIYRNEADELAQSEDSEKHYVNVILPRKAQAYAEYVRKRSLWGDLKILGQTVRAVVFG